MKKSIERAMLARLEASSFPSKNLSYTSSAALSPSSVQFSSAQGSIARLGAVGPWMMISAKLYENPRS